MQDSPDKYVAHLDQRVTHLDSRVSMIEQHTAAINTKLDTLGSSFKEVASRVNSPQQTNWAGLVGSVISVLTLIGTIGILSLAPMRADIQEVKRVHGEDRQRLLAELKVLMRDSAVGSFDRAQLNQHINSLNSQMDEVRQAVAAAKVSRKSIGDYSRESRTIMSRAREVQGTHNHQHLNQHMATPNQ